MVVCIKKIILKSRYVTHESVWKPDTQTTLAYRMDTTTRMAYLEAYITHKNTVEKACLIGHPTANSVTTCYDFSGSVCVVCVED